METAVVILITATFTAVLVYVLAARRTSIALVERDALRMDLRVSQTKQENAETARQLLQSDTDKLRNELLTATNERERATALGKRSEESATELINERNDCREQLLLAQSVRSEVSAELQVTAAQLKREIEVTKTLRSDLDGRDIELREKDKELISAVADLAGIKTERAGLRTQLDAQKKWIEEQTKRFEEAVLAAAMKLMEERGKAFTESNKKEIDAVIAPFKDQLNEFRSRIDEIHSTDAKDRGILHEQIVQLTSVNRVVSEQADRLVSALTITSKSTGDWGETILQRILEDSGLRVGKEYELQFAVAGAENERLQPDAVIFLPEKRQLVIDAKVSNKAWTAYCSEKDEVRREQLFAEHLASIRAHVKNLSAKGYSNAPELRGLDFVLMFVPVEGALLAALAHDATLYTDSYRNKVILVTPSTLMAVIKLVEGIWTFQKRKESVDEIAEAGRKLYEKLTSFASTFVEVGTAVGKTREVYERAYAQLATGKGNAIRLAERMVELGVGPAPGKVMPAPLLARMNDDGEGDTNSMPALDAEPTGSRVDSLPDFAGTDLKPDLVPS
jgi:DNA recombination protein RmuC